MTRPTRAVVTPTAEVPADEAAERAVLGGVLLDDDRASRDEILDRLVPRHFSVSRHRLILEGAVFLRQVGRAPNLISVTDRLRETGKLDVAGGPLYVTRLLDAAPFSSAMLPELVQILEKYAGKRDFLQLAEVLAHGARNGHGVDELVTLTQHTIDGLRESVHSSIERDSNERVTGAALMAAVEDDVEWFQFLRLEGVLGRGLALLLASFAKVGKTTLIVSALRTLLSAGLRVRFYTEESRGVWRKRLVRYPELDSDRLVFDFGIGRPWKDTLARLERDEVAFDVVVVDTVRNWCGIVDENDAGQMTAALLPAIRLARRRRCALILVQHLRKSPSESVGVGIAGSHALVGLVDVAVEVHRDRHVRTRRVCRAVSRFEETPQEWVAELRDDDFVVLGDPKTIAADELAQRVLAVLDADTGRTRDEISELLDPEPSRGHLHTALAKITKDGRAARTGTGRKGDSHKWTLSKSFIQTNSHIGERTNSDGKGPG